MKAIAITVAIVLTGWFMAGVFISLNTTLEMENAAQYQVVTDGKYYYTDNYEVDYGLITFTDIWGNQYTLSEFTIKSQK